MGVVLISADLSNGELSMRAMYHLLIMTLQSEQVLPVIFSQVAQLAERCSIPYEIGWWDVGHEFDPHLDY